MKAIDELTAILTAYSDKQYREERLMRSEIKALKEAIKAVELMGCIVDRPCEACKHHSTGSCSQWICVFDEWLYGEHN